MNRFDPTVDVQDAIINLGEIAASGGDVFLIAHAVDNQGAIRAPGGQVGLIAGLFAALAVACATPDDPAHGSSWDYAEHGPGSWGELSPDYVLAKVGGSQSPIDIRTGEVIGADLPELSIEAHPVAMHLINNGHTVEAIAPGGDTLHFGDHEYELKQFHCHSPSEHTIDGEHAELELHFVHADGQGHLAVVAVLFSEGVPERPALESLARVDLVENPRDEVLAEDVLLDVSTFLPDSLQYYTYDGSLTTPPASEGVRWFVLANRLHLTREQLDTIEAVYNSNNRPVQPTNARFVLTRR